jgi:hypothetical protein
MEFLNCGNCACIRLALFIAPCYVDTCGRGVMTHARFLRSAKLPVYLLSFLLLLFERLLSCTSYKYSCLKCVTGKVCSIGKAHVFQTRYDFTFRIELYVNL